MFDYERTRGTLTVRLRGELDHGACAKVREKLDQLLADRHIRTLVLDLEALGFMDSSGIGLIIGRYKLMTKRGGSVMVKNADRRMDRLFEMAGLYRLVEKTV